MDIGAELKGKVGPFPLYVWLLGMTGLGLVAYFLLKKKSGTPTTGTPGTPCTQSDGSAGTWDSTGTVCQATTVSTVNSNMGQGGNWAWRAQSTTATATTTPTTTAAASTPDNTASTVPPTQAPVSASKVAGAISNLRVTGYNKTGASFAWNPVSNATQGYAWNLTGPTSQHGVTMMTHVSVNGLKKGVYNFGVQALPGGPGNNIHTPEIKG